MIRRERESHLFLGDWMVRRADVRGGQTEATWRGRGLGKGTDLCWSPIRYRAEVWPFLEEAKPPTQGGGPAPALEPPDTWISYCSILPDRNRSLRPDTRPADFLPPKLDFGFPVKGLSLVQLEGRSSWVLKFENPPAPHVRPGRQASPSSTPGGFFPLV